MQVIAEAIKHGTDQGVLSIGGYPLVTTPSKDLIPIAGGIGLSGLLVESPETGDPAQLRFKDEDLEDLSVLDEKTWTAIQRGRSIKSLPEIINVGADDGIPYYVSNIPNGEPITEYLLRNSKRWNRVVAAKMIHRFVIDLLNQTYIRFDQYTLSKESIWLVSEHREPRLVLGDLAMIEDPNADRDNALCLFDLMLKLSSGGDAVFSNLSKLIKKGPIGLYHLDESLEAYFDLGKVRVKPEWLNDCQPESYLANIRSKKPKRHSSREKAKKPEITTTKPRTKNPTPKLKKAGFTVKPFIYGVALLAAVGFVYSKVSTLPKDVEPTDVSTSQESLVTEQSVEAIFEQASSSTLVASIDTGPSLDHVLHKPLAADSDHANPTPPPATPQLIEAARSARDRGNYMEAIRLEVEASAAIADTTSIDKRVGSDIFKLSETKHIVLKEQDVGVLYYLALKHPQANDLIMKHFREAGSYFKEIEVLVESDQPDSLREAGEQILKNPRANKEERETAVQYFTEAAELGDRPAMFLAAQNYLFGTHIEKNPTKGIEYLRQSNQLGSTRGKVLLGRCLVEGLGVEPNYTEASFLFYEAIQLGSPEAYARRGLLFLNGQGVDVNIWYAADLFEKGALGDNALAMVEYAQCYETGIGRSKNFNQAAYWYKKAAKKGSERAIEWCSSSGVKIE